MLRESCGELLRGFRNSRTCHAAACRPQGLQTHFPHFSGTVSTSILCTFNSLQSQTHRKFVISPISREKVYFVQKQEKSQINQVIQSRSHSMPAAELGLKTASLSFLIILTDNNSQTKCTCNVKLCRIITADFLKVPFLS